MTYVINEPCIGTKDSSCVEVRPVDCIHPTPAGREWSDGTLDTQEYDQFLEQQIRATIERQERLGLDVLVHGEPERSDMVAYVAERLRGFASTEHGWVQSYGSRCVKPSILFGDVSRPSPITVRWWRFAQSLTVRPVKAMLTGP